jgi:GntR family transcriptional repressor for pyruvate dehydrogenase complex
MIADDHPLAAKLLDYVEVTGLRVGDRLPFERDLAEALRVSRASVRQATVALEVPGDPGSTTR